MYMNLRCLFYHDWLYNQTDDELTRICNRCYKKMIHYSDLDDSFWRTVSLNKEDIRDKKIKELGL